MQFALRTCRAQFSHTILINLQAFVLEFLELLHIIDLNIKQLSTFFFRNFFRFVTFPVGEKKYWISMWIKYTATSRKYWETSALPHLWCKVLHSFKTCTLLRLNVPESTGADVHHLVWSCSSTDSYNIIIIVYSQETVICCK